VLAAISTAEVDRRDFIVYEAGEPVGTIYENIGNGISEERWFWSITVYVDPQLEIATSGKSKTFKAKERFRTSW
jgi:hypothetical protein